MIRQIIIILGCLAAGELTVSATGIPIPSSIIGMLLLTALLKIGIVKLSHVEGIATILTQNLAFFFIPPGVAIMIYFDLLSANLWPVVAAAFGSTVIVLMVSGHTHQLIRRLTKPNALRHKK